MGGEYFQARPRAFRPCFQWKQWTFWISWGYSIFERTKVSTGPMSLVSWISGRRSWGMIFFFDLISIHANFSPGRSMIRSISAPSLVHR